MNLSTGDRDVLIGIMERQLVITVQQQTVIERLEKRIAQLEREAKVKGVNFWHLAGTALNSLATRRQLRASPQVRTVAIPLKTNLDNDIGERLGFAKEQLFAVGARDDWHTPVQMKRATPPTCSRSWPPPNSKPNYRNPS